MDRGTYALLIKVRNEATLTVGKLGEFQLPLGYYLYCGSALGGLEARIKRHLRPEKRIHWHIDYLLQHADVVEVWCIISDQRVECVLCDEARQLFDAMDLAPGFGSSDCRCPSHLLYFTTKPSFTAFRRKLLKRGLMLVRW